MEELDRSFDSGELYELCGTHIYNWSRPRLRIYINKSYTFSYENDNYKFDYDKSKLEVIIENNKWRVINHYGSGVVYIYSFIV